MISMSIVLVNLINKLKSAHLEKAKAWAEYQAIEVEDKRLHMQICEMNRKRDSLLDPMSSLYTRFSEADKDVRNATRDLDAHLASVAEKLVSKE